MQETIMQQGVSLMMFGMGTVFVFLTLLVFITGLMSSVMTRFFPDEVKPVLPSGNSAGNAVDGRTLAIIKAALAQHRKKP